MSDKWFYILMAVLIVMYAGTLFVKKEGPHKPHHWSYDMRDLPQKH
jgi:hypothetical protein